MSRKIHAQIAAEAFKERNLYPPLEEIVPHLQYALSLSPDLVSKAYIEQYRHFEERIRPCLVGNVILRPELSTKSTRWHYHGTISFDNYVQITAFYQHLSVLKEHSTIVLAEIDTFDWYLYCIKQRAHIKSYINANYNVKKQVVPYKIKFSKKTTHSVTPETSINKSHMLDIL